MPAAALVGGPGPGRADARRAVAGHRAREARQVRSTRPVREAAPTRVRDAASASVGPPTRVGMSVAGAAVRTPRGIGRGRRLAPLGVVGDGASTDHGVQAVAARAARAARPADGPGIGPAGRVVVVRRFLTDPAGIDRGTSAPLRRLRRGSRATAARAATDRRSAAVHRVIARVARVAVGRDRPVRPSTVAGSSARASTGPVRIEAGSGGHRRIVPGRRRRGRRHHSGRRSRHPTCWPTTRSSLPGVDRSRRRSSRAGPPIGCSSSRSAVRRSSASCFTRRASGSRSSRSRAGR
jgi:hypothetical protein